MYLTRDWDKGFEANDSTELKDTKQIYKWDWWQPHSCVISSVTTFFSHVIIKILKWLLIFSLFFSKNFNLGYYRRTSSENKPWWNKVLYKSLSHAWIFTTAIKLHLQPQNINSPYLLSNIALMLFWELGSSSRWWPL